MGYKLITLFWSLPNYEKIKRRVAYEVLLKTASTGLGTPRNTRSREESRM